MSRCQKRWFGVASVSALTLALSGCVGLPTASPVVSGQAINGSGDREAIAIEPNGPGVSDDPRQIAQGFMQAQISSDDNYAIAREFLTNGAQTAWKPGTTSTVFGSESQLSITRPDVGTVVLSVPIVGTLSPDGRLTRANPGTTAALKFGMAHTTSGWRITSVPKNMGVWISEDDFLRTYTAESIYYPSRSGATLVPDARWLPKIGLTTALARAALSQPSPWLKDVVASPFPASTDLQVDSVPVNHSGVADVSLTSTALTASAAQKTAIWAALAATLDEDPSVSAINITVHGRRLETDNLPTSVRLPRDVGFALPPTSLSSLILRTGRFSAWTNAFGSRGDATATGEGAKNQPKLPAISPDWSFVAAGQGGQQIAAVSENRTSVRRWVSGAQLSTTNIGENLGQLDFDAQGWLWAAGEKTSGDTGMSLGGSSGRELTRHKVDVNAASTSAAIWAMDTAKSSSNAAASLSVPWLKQRVLSMALSPEGDRIALVLQGSGGAAHTRVVVAGVIRNASGAPVALGLPQQLPVAMTSMTNVVWADPVDLAVLGTYENQRQPVLVTMDGDGSGLGPVAGADALVSTWNGGDGLFIHTAEGAVYNRLGSAWNRFVTRGEVIAPTS